MRFRPSHALGLCLITGTGVLAYAAGGIASRTGTDHGWKQHDIHRPRPPVVEPADAPLAAKAPKDAIVLFDGTNLDAWQGSGNRPAPWKVADGAFEIVPGTGAIQTRAEFGDVQVHLEWSSPSPAKGKGQDRGNTGLFLMGRYETQILDSYQAETYADGQAGAIYGQYPPLFNASRPPGEWQSYDIAFRRPRFDAKGDTLEPARLTLFHNGILVQNNEELLGQTLWLKWADYEAHGDTGPIELQDHGHPVRFRNFWVRNLPARPEPGPETLRKPALVKLSDDALDQFVGGYGTATRKGAAAVEITRDDGHLLVKFPFQPKPLVLEPTAPTVFALRHTDGRFRFQVGANGHVNGTVFEIGDGERTMTKLKR